MTGGELLERDGELARIDALLARRGGVLALEGPPGIGKSSLLDAAAERAAGFALARASGSELERDFGYGVVRQLFEPLPAGPLEGAEALAAPALGLPGEPAAERYGVIHGLYWLTASLAGAEPLLLLVDDLQWADPPSQRFLAYLARRLDGLDAALIVATRPALPGEDRTLVDAVTAGAATLRPAPLSAGAVAKLAESRLGVAAPEFAAAAYAATGGHPLWVDAVLADPAGPLDRIGPERVARDVLRRVEALGPDAGALTRAIAVLGDHGTLDAAAALAGLDPSAAAGIVAALSASDVLAHDATPRFRHPVVRAAIADALAPAEAAVAHGRAARLLDERSAPPAAVAAHLRLAPPAGDAWAVERLRAAARVARDQGVPELAAALLERALAEPPGAERPAVLRELGSAELAAGFPRGVERLRTAIDQLADARERAAVAIELSGSLHVLLGPGGAIADLERALAELGPDDDELRLTLEALAATHARMDLGAGPSAVARLRRRTAGLTGATPAERFAIASLAAVDPADSAARHARVAELLLRALASGPPAARLSESGVASNLIRAGRLDDAEAHVEPRLVQARNAGQLSRAAVLLQMRGWIACERGALPAAEADETAALALADELELPGGPGAALLAFALAEQGRLDEADAALSEYGVDGALPEHQVMNPVLFHRARVRLAQGRRDEGLADLLEVGRRYERWGIVRAVPHWRSLAAVELGDERLAAEELELARRWDTPLSIGLAERGLGLVRGDPGLLAQAAETLAASPARLEHARAALDAGTVEHLRRALELALACGAVPLAERAHEALIAAGAEPPPLAPDRRSASERRVSELAARGLSDREIAQELFITTAAVAHLKGQAPLSKGA